MDECKPLAIGAARGGSSATSTSTTAGAACMDNFPPLWVTRWVDYTSKYGLGGAWRIILATSSSIF